MQAKVMDPLPEVRRAPIGGVGRMMTAIPSEAELLRAVFEELGAGVYAIDMQGRIIMINPWAQQRGHADLGGDAGPKRPRSAAPPR